MGAWPEKSGAEEKPQEFRHHPHHPYGRHGSGDGEPGEEGEALSKLRFPGPAGLESLPRDCLRSFKRAAHSQPHG